MNMITTAAAPITAGRPLSLIVSELERATWGDLSLPQHRCARVLLGVLAGMLNPHKGTGQATVAQLAGRSGYSTRWTAQGLRDLEHMGLLEWDRGTIVRGKAVPSRFRLDKRLLSDLVNHARGLRREAEKLARAAFRTRLGTLRTSTLPRHKQKPRSTHVEVGSTLPLTGSEATPRIHPRTATGAGARGANLARAELAAARAALNT